MTTNLSLPQIKALAAVRSILAEKADRLYLLADYADFLPSDTESEILDCVTKLRDAEAVLLRCING